MSNRAFTQRNPPPDAEIYNHYFHGNGLTENHSFKRAGEKVVSHMLKKVAAVLLVLAILPAGAFACTAVYVGSDLISVFRMRKARKKRGICP